MPRPLSPVEVELLRLKDEIAAHAGSYGLDFYEVVFEVLDYDEMNEVAAFGGFPTRYPHWRFGMQYEQIAKGHSYGLQKIYELVINNDPCYAYLLRSNSLVDQKMVMAHVYGHCDFFKNNYWFGRTSRKMMDQMANHGTRVRRYIDLYGLEAVEEFIDACLSLENLIDLHAPFIRRHEERPRTEVGEEEDEEERFRAPVRKLRAKDYMDKFVNPPEFLEEQRQAMEERLERQRRFPEEPERDVLAFLIQHAPLDRWQRDVLTIVRDEAYYFAPQGMTKIMNEGWASYWHSRIMTERVCGPDEIIDYADHHSGTLGTQPGVVNPYKLGIELFRDIERRWDTGRFGLEWERCGDAAERARWDRGLGLGRERVFQVRKIYNDVTFIDEFLTEDFAEEQKLFTYGWDKQLGQYVIQDRDFRKVKQKLLEGLTNFGQPFIHVDNANYQNRGELYLVHEHAHSGVDLRQDHARDTLKNLYRLWSRPVHVRTVMEGRDVVLSYDGKKHAERSP
ncbi:MAG: SpoVR family protein [Planctomycetes bacterium]|nr:SpoVR family protein [Planctomycetota bacterium]